MMSSVGKAEGSNIVESDVPDTSLLPVNNSSNEVVVEVPSVPKALNGSEAKSSEPKSDAAASTPVIFLWKNDKIELPS